MPTDLLALHITHTSDPETHHFHRPLMSSASPPAPSSAAATAARNSRAAAAGVHQSAAKADSILAFGENHGFVVLVW
jgi:hypothetical protein